MQTYVPFLLALLVPVMQADQYWGFFTKPFLELVIWKDNTPSGKILHDNAIRVWVILSGAAMLPLMALGLSTLVKINFPATNTSLTVAAILGAAAGGASIGDFHLFDILRSIPSLGSLIPPSNPPPPSADVGHSPPS